MNKHYNNFNNLVKILLDSVENTSNETPVFDFKKMGMDEIAQISGKAMDVNELHEI